jgi:hypothetical protein
LEWRFKYQFPDNKSASSWEVNTRVVPTIGDVMEPEAGIRKMTGGPAKYTLDA